MPLPNYGYYNKEEKKHQDLVFQGAPQIVDVEEPLDPYGANGNSRKESRKRGQVTTGEYIKFIYGLMKIVLNTLVIMRLSLVW